MENKLALPLILLGMAVTFFGVSMSRVLDASKARVIESENGKRILAVYHSREPDEIFLENSSGEYSPFKNSYFTPDSTLDRLFKPLIGQSDAERAERREIYSIVNSNNPFKN